ncbi:uncharacterized protein [Spinacia oleracea]|uniref:Aspartic peptidase DDI1-type domain-containing protein n=1 Tax=Spinacia oleracea TaxID=3562 RepID=A0ABM3RQQ9_SPIOL|nr:uncharacterized protein LOC130471717 [Spinacia oleracea]
MIETQLAQLASTIKEQQVHTSLPPQGQPPKQMYAIVTRSGKTLDDGVTHVEAQCSRGGNSKGDESSDHDDEEGKSHVDGMSDGDKSKETTLLPLPTPTPPYPLRFVGKKMDDQFHKFWETISKLYVSLSFTEALKQMPHYSRFMRDILSGKRGCEPKETVQLTESCSALIQHSFPPKLNDPGSFFIPCSIQKLKFENALCDLGASVSILPYKIFEKLTLGDLSLTAMSLQLADRSVMFPLGRIEDVPLVVGKLTFLVDFVVLDIDEDAHTPIILGRPFLATAGALIDVQGGLITLKAGDAKASFKLTIDDQCCPKMNSCMKIDTLACVENNHTCANSSNYFHVSKCANKLARSSLGEKEVHGDPKTLGDEFDDVVTILELFEMHDEDVNGAKRSKVFHRSAKKAKQSKKVKNPSIPEERHVGGSFGFRLLKGGIGKIFVPKGAKKCMVTSVDPKLVVFDPP